MKARDLIYWLQGYFELHGPGPLTAEQSACIARHLAMVFVHEIDPSMGPAEMQNKLNTVHGQLSQSPVPAIEFLPQNSVDLTHFKC